MILKSGFQIPETSISSVHTIFVTGSDTGVGKTYIVAAIARLFADRNRKIQIIKAVETGRTSTQPGDAEQAAKLSEVAGTENFTLFRFQKPLAPLAAAEEEGKTFSISSLLDRWQQLPPADLRIVEGAGGIAVPLDPDGRDWSDFAKMIAADRTILAIADRLGAINQARLTHAYARTKNLRSGIWLNENSPQPSAIRESNRRSLADFLWATQRFNKLDPEDPAPIKQFLFP